MKKLYGLFCISIFLSAEPGYTQPDSVLSYLPLHLGNQWQYRVHYVVNNTNIDTTYYSLLTVKRDTVMPNGYQYQLIENESETIYVHIDSTTACVYEYEYDLTQGVKTDSLLCSEGDWFGRDGYCELIDTATVLNYLTWTMLIHHPRPDISESHTLAMGIGISYQEIITTYSYGTAKTCALVYANINGVEYGELVTTTNEALIKINNYTLNQNYPNPFNPTTTINYSIPQRSLVIIKIFDIIGNEVETLVNEEKPMGMYETNLNAINLASGVYFYRIQAGSFINVKKMILLK
ncbi:MAG: T9SS type A sorting domain-containing protein [Ignavibacteriaceae bacterium]